MEAKSGPDKLVAAVITPPICYYKHIQALFQETGIQRNAFAVNIAEIALPNTSAPGINNAQGKAAAHIVGKADVDNYRFIPCKRVGENIYIKAGTNAAAPGIDSTLPISRALIPIGYSVATAHRQVKWILAAISRCAPEGIQTGGLGIDCCSRQQAEKQEYLLHHQEIRSKPV